MTVNRITLSMSFLILFFIPLAYADHETKNSSITSDSDYKIGTISWEKDIYHISEPAIIQVKDADRNNDPDNIETIGIEVWSDTYPRGIDISLMETDFDTGVFEGTVIFTTPDGVGGPGNEDGIVLLWIGDMVIAEYTDKTLPLPYRPGDELDITSATTVTDKFSKVEDDDGDFQLERYRILDENNRSLQLLETGNTYKVAVDLSNEQINDQHFAYALLIEEPTSNLIDPIWITGYLQPKENSSLELKWRPQTPGQYAMTIEIWDDPEPDKRNLIVKSVNFSVTVEGDAILTESEIRDLKIAELQAQVKELQNLAKSVEEPTSGTYDVIGDRNKPDSKIASFVDADKDPQHYIDRYYNESKYKEWFDKNYPNYTIEEAVGLNTTSEKITQKPKLPEWVRNIFIWYAEKRISEGELLGSIEFLIEQKIIQVNPP